MSKGSRRGLPLPDGMRSSGGCSKAITLITNRGVNGYCWSSSLWTGGSNARNLNFNFNNANVNHNVPGNRFPLRLVRVKEYATARYPDFFSNHATEG